MPKIGAYFPDEVWSVILEAHNIQQHNSEEDYGLRKLLIHTYRDSTVRYVNDLLKKNTFQKRLILIDDKNRRRNKIVIKYIGKKNKNEKKKKKISESNKEIFGFE